MNWDELQKSQFNSPIHSIQFNSNSCVFRAYSIQFNSIHCVPKMWINSNLIQFVNWICPALVCTHMNHKKCLLLLSTKCATKRSVSEVKNITLWIKVKFSSHYLIMVSNQRRSLTLYTGATTFKFIDWKRPKWVTPLYWIV